jgi:hypothetical protein
MNAKNVVEAEIEGAKGTTVIVLETGIGNVIGRGTDDGTETETETETVKGATVAPETDQTVGTLIEIEIANVRGKGTETKMIAGAKGKNLTAQTATMRKGPSEKSMYSSLRANRGLFTEHMSGCSIPGTSLMNL